MTDRFFTLLILFFLPAGLVRAQEHYEAGNIPPELASGADAVIRTMDMQVEVRSLNRVDIKVRKVVTVLNEQGNQEADVAIWYNESRRVKSVNGRVYDRRGALILEIKSGQLEDVSAADHATLFSDSRIKRLRMSPLSYPYTLELEYEIRSRQTLWFPDWYPCTSSRVGVEHARYTFSCPADFDIRYKELNYPGSVQVSSAGKGGKQYTWELDHQIPWPDEPFHPDPEHFLVSVKVAPTEFAYKNNQGAFTDWTAFGKWIYDDLLSGRDEVPAETAARIRELTGDIADPRQKARKIYEYMQQKTRYISIQIGIGGWQPFSAEETDRLGYGDCKGLVNYTRALLKVAGIDAYYCIVQAGERKQDLLPDFASINQGNHIILCIPFPGDTTWLECTSKEMPFGFLGNFTDDRRVLACTEEGGKLMHTPAYPAGDNKQLRRADLTIDDQGSLSGRVSTRFEGTRYHSREDLAGESFSRQLRKIYDIYPIDHMDIESYKLEEEKGYPPVRHEKLVFEAGRYGTLNGDRLSFRLNALNQLERSVRNTQDRLLPVHINRGYRDKDEIVYELPENYEVEAMPEAVTIESDFGTFGMEIRLEGEESKLRYIREMQLKEGTFPAEAYPELAGFYQQIKTADNSRVMLVRKK